MRLARAEAHVRARRLCGACGASGASAGSSKSGRGRPSTRRSRRRGSNACRPSLRRAASPASRPSRNCARACAGSCSTCAGSACIAGPGDRLAVMPDNDPQLVARTLRALRASGDELVDLTPDWVHALGCAPAAVPAPPTPRWATSSPSATSGLSRARRSSLLHALTYDGSLRSILEARTEDQWELWDLLEPMARAGLAPGDCGGPSAATTRAWPASCHRCSRACTPCRASRPAPWRRSGSS